MAYTLDTAAAIDRIVAAGAEPALARAIVAEVARSDDAAATKSDLAALRSELLAAIAASQRNTILAGLAIAGLLFAALRLFGG